MDSNSPNTQALPAGTRLEEFVIERVLGSGGFGITYLARDTRLDRRVVIKENLPVQFCFRDTHSLTVAPRHSNGEDVESFHWSLENFSKEAAMLASLDHPGIVKVLRSFEAFGTAYFVMPYLEGLTFDELIVSRRAKGQTFSEDELRGFLCHVLGALGYLHDRGVYHRDIKPGNLFVTLEGMPVLIDFGSARQRLSERSMTVIESAGYTPFEQLQSRGNVGPWSDLYALAATLVKVITGEAPPKAMDRMRKDPYQLLTGRVDLQSVLKSGFLHAIDKALAVDDVDRWQSAEEWLGALSGRRLKLPPPLEPMTTSTGAAVRHPVSVDVPAAPSPPRPRHPVPVVVPTELLPPPLLEKTVDSRTTLKASVPVILLCGFLLWLAMKAMMSSSGSESRAPDDKEDTAQVEQFEVAPDPIDAGEANLVLGTEPARDAQPVRDEVNVNQPGEEQEFEISSGVTMTFCWIPPGEFVMGSPVNEEGRGGDEAQVNVILSNGFWLGKYEVTQAQWGALMGENPSHFRGGNLPVETVSWNDAQEFLEKLNARLGSADGCRMKLPTEAQWEYAARAGEDGPYSGGSLDPVGWYVGNSGVVTHPVGLKKANVWGLHDMNGNVWEWCADWYGNTLSGGLNPNLSAPGSYKVYRGGSWSDVADNCRVANRYALTPTLAMRFVGFRVARSSVP